MQFPVSIPNDGKVDLVIQPMVSSCLSLSLSHPYTDSASAPFFSSQLSRTEMLKGFEGAETGAIYWRDDVNIFRVSTQNR
jgi:hypothetical protein